MSSLPFKWTGSRGLAACGVLISTVSLLWAGVLLERDVLAKEVWDSSSSLATGTVWESQQQHVANADPAELWAGAAEHRSLTMVTEGRIGNELFRWASLVGISRLHAITPCLQKSTLAEWFVGPFGAERCATFNEEASKALTTSTTVHADKFATFEQLAIPARPNTVKLTGYVQSWKYFDSLPIGPLRAALRFNPRIQNQADAFMKQFDGKPAVGIHVRHGDLLMYGYINFPSARYFRAAMTRFRQKHGQAIQFIVATDDAAWCKQQEVFNADDVHVVAQKHLPAVDMAILASCVDIIMTVGTFGWWAAWLGPHQRGGEVVFYRHEFNLDHAINKGKVVEADYYPSTWTPMGDLADRQLAHALSTGNCPASKGMWHAIILWAHGMQFFDEIVQEIHNSKDFWIARQSIVKVQDLDKLINVVYAEDMKGDKRKHIETKTKYLKAQPLECVIMAVYDTAPNPTSYGEGIWKITANKRTVDLKWKIRKQFNPKDAAGEMTHQHVLHISDNADDVVPVLAFAGLPTPDKLVQSHSLFFTPYFITPPTTYAAVTVDIDTLRVGCAVSSGNCTAGESVALVDSPQYAYATGNVTAWADYFMKGRLKGYLTDDHTVASFQELQLAFNASSYPKCACGLDGKLRRSMILTDTSGQIHDGAHRAALLRFQGVQRVAVIRMGVPGPEIQPCDSTQNNALERSVAPTVKMLGASKLAHVQRLIAWLDRLGGCTRAVVFKVDHPETFPSYLKLGSDVDVLVESLDTAIACLDGAAGIDKVSRLPGGKQAQLDSIGADGSVNVRLDIYQDFTFTESGIPAAFKESVLAESSSEHTMAGVGWRKPALEHECAIRRMEWQDWHEARPDKKKHLLWNKEHGCPSRFWDPNITWNDAVPQPNPGSHSSVCVVEVPKGSDQKRELGYTPWNTGPKHLRSPALVDRTMPLGMIANYGFMPQTFVAPGRLWDGNPGDGDPLDCIVVGPALGTGTVVHGEVLGLLEFVDGGKADGKIVIAPPAAKDVPWTDMSAFFLAYKKGNPTKLSNGRANAQRASRERATEMIRGAHAEWLKLKPTGSTNASPQ